MRTVRYTIHHSTQHTTHLPPAAVQQSVQRPMSSTTMAILVQLAGYQHNVPDYRASPLLEQINSSIRHTFHKLPHTPYKGIACQVVCGDKSSGLIASLGHCLLLNADCSALFLFTGPNEGNKQTTQSNTCTPSIAQQLDQPTLSTQLTSCLTCPPPLLLLYSPSHASP